MRSATTSSAPTSPPVSAAAAVTSVTQPTSTPNCESATAAEQIVIDHIEHAEWSLAEAAAEATLRRAGLCQADREVLQKQKVIAGLENIFATPFSAQDIPAQQGQVTDYLSLRQWAMGAGVPFPTDLQVAQRACQAGRFLLCKSAFDQAIANQTFNRYDLGLVSQYSDALYNLGTSWVRGDRDAYQQGLRMLVASYLIAKGHQASSTRSWDELRDLLGPDEQQWPKPADTPLLPMR
ncbi:MAG TPA: hypothetical protein VF952_00780 [Chloroflexia bacterium]